MEGVSANRWVPAREQVGTASEIVCGSTAGLLLDLFHTDNGASKPLIHTAECPKLSFSHQQQLSRVKNI